MSTSHSPPALPHHEAKRPKGILKNPSFIDSPALQSPAAETPNPMPSIPDANVLFDKDTTIQNTLQNAGRRRSSSMLDRTNSSGSRRQSMQSRTNSTTDAREVDPEASPSLKWDEANLYLNEQSRTSTMKITEPKTPYAKHYDPMEDEDELKRIEAQGEDDNVQLLDAKNLDVDELDMAKGKEHSGSGSGEVIGTKPRGLFKEDEIPGLDIGEPEEDPSDFQPKDSSRLVGSGKSVVLEDDGLHGGREEEEEEEDDAEKHKHFQELRKKHYEMANVKDLLGHPEEIEEDDEDDDGDLALRDAPDAVPPVPSLPNGAV